MVISKKKKSEIVDRAVRLAKSAHSILTLDYKGLNVSQSSDLYAMGHDLGVKVLVIKNTLARIALRRVSYAPLADNLRGQTAFAFSLNEVRSAAELVKRFREEVYADLAVTNAFIYGKGVNREDIDAIANLPTREQSLASLLGCIQAPIAKLGAVLLAPVSKLTATVAAVAAARHDQES